MHKLYFYTLLILSLIYCIRANPCNDCCNNPTSELCTDTICCGTTRSHLHSEFGKMDVQCCSSDQHCIRVAHHFICKQNKQLEGNNNNNIISTI
jgi:hypothetical protein